MSHIEKTPTTPLLDNPERRLVMVGRGLGLTATIGREVLNLTGLERKKNVLIVPSAASTPDNYDKAVGDATAMFAKVLGANIDVLHGFPNDPTEQDIGDKLHEADAVWMVGGSSQKAKAQFDRTGFGDALIASRGKVISGGSAGMVLQGEVAMSWFTPVGKPEENAFVPADGLAIVRTAISPHLDYIETDDGLTLPRSHYFKPFLEKEGLTSGHPALGVDDAAALAFDGNSYRVLAQDDAGPNVGVTAFFYEAKGNFREVHHLPTASYAPISQLVTIA